MLYVSFSSLPLYLSVQIAKNYPGIKYDEMVIDSAMLYMASNPNRFDVMVSSLALFLALL